jgi:hypothetical protein
MVHTCNPSYLGGGDKRMVAQGWPLGKVQYKKQARYIGAHL